MINNQDRMPKKRRRRTSELASKSTSGRPGPKSNKQAQVVAILRRNDGATIAEIATEVGWSASSITRIVQWLLFACRLGIREIRTAKRADGTTVYRAA